VSSRTSGGTAVLFCQPTSEETGSEHSLLQILRGLRGSGLRRYVLVGRPGPMEARFRDESEGCFQVRSEKLRRSLRGVTSFLLSFITLPLAVRRLCKEHGIDVVYVNSLMFPQAILAGRLNRCRVITHVREVQSTYPGPVYSAYLALAALASDRIVCVCEYSRRQRVPFARRFLGRSVVIHNTSDFPASQVERNPLPVIRLLAVIPISDRKGAPVLPDVLHRLRRLVPGCTVHLDVVGSSRDARAVDRLIDKAKKLDVLDLMSVHGAQPDVALFYRAAHVLLHPSRTEAFPRVIVEAMNFGLPVVATEVGGSGEAVVDGETGYLVAVDDADGMARRVVEIVHPPDVYRRFSEHALRRYRAMLSPGVISTQIREAILATNEVSRDQTLGAARRTS
jgi:glycosyltransferase involved in cell wall biosynthesis